MTSVEDSRTEKGSCRVTLSRTDSADVQQRQVYARLDDGPSHMLLFGDTITLEVPAGDHVLRANNTLFRKRVAFFLAPGQHVEFALINRAGLLGLGFLALLGAAPLTLTVERRSVAGTETLEVRK